MSETKHTPGPWIAAEWTCHAPTTIRAKAAGVIVAETTGFGESSDLCIANAKLIAAAPELLQACKMIERWIELENEDDPEIEKLTLLTVSEHVEAAIAKAEGKEVSNVH